MFELIALFAVAFGIAGVVMTIFKVLRRPMPKYVIPLAAGIAMLTYSIWNDYAWYERSAEQLPDYIKVVKTYDGGSPMQFWTYMFPFVDRFVVINTQTFVHPPDQPNYVSAEINLVQRRDATRSIDMLFDCKGWRYSDIPADAVPGEDGLPTGLQWADGETDDALLTAACR